MKEKILFVSSSISFHENFLFETINNLSKTNDIYVIANCKFKTKNFKNINLINIPISRKINILSDFICTLLLVKNFYKIKPDRIISSSPKGGFLTSMAIYFYLNNKKKKCHIATGQLWYDKKKLNRLIFKYIDKFIFNSSKLIIADSKSQINFLKSEGFDGSKIKLIYKGSIKGVDTSIYKKNQKERNRLRKELNFKKNEIVILYLGRINQQKGIPMLYDAFNKLIINKLKVKLLIVGRDEENLITQLNKKYTNISNEVNYLQYTNHAYKFYSCADIFCLPSSREGFGMSIIEASSCELPIIASDVVGIQDSVQNNKTGILFNIKNKNSFNIKLERLIYDKSLRSKLAKNGRKYVLNNFDEKKVVPFLLDLIKEF